MCILPGFSVAEGVLLNQEVFRMNKFPVQLVVSDIDDTLIHKEDHLNEKIIQTIEELKRRGIQFTLATGRMPYRAESYAGDAKLTVPFIANNGSILYDRGRMIWCKMLYAKIIQEITQRYMERNPQFTVIFSFTDRECPLVRTEWIRKRLGKYKGYDQTLGNTPDVWNQTVHKIYVLDDARSGIIGAFADELEYYRNEISFFQYGEFSIEIVAGGCSKASGLTRLLEYLSIPADCVMAVGDHTNDIELIKKAGIGVAVANADSQLKAAADYVTAGERDLGVKEAIEKFVLSE
ncbi:Cof-type HAD-IIB family hydrolase [Hungatella hathewayi]|uniref:Cof-like hydrolase n=3 Tax=Lachnospiraceae TaxID=186803 RepID=D3AEM6_9FIRM|nr:Cof-like hydrolase [Hungatella hathewayi DSM 13479]MUB63015.1 Cof-type HAD-IIB family hydrolase [Hungatella hathewayi]